MGRIGGRFVWVSICRKLNQQVPILVYRCVHTSLSLAIQSFKRHSAFITLSTPFIYTHKMNFHTRIYWFGLIFIFKLFGLNTFEVSNTTLSV
jgi:hypothetical protein